jgi:hypothetical protein
MSQAFTHITDSSAAAFVADAAVPCRLAGIWADSGSGSGFGRNALVQTLPLLAVRRTR